MAVLQSSVNWVLQQFRARLGNPYVFGGHYSATDVQQGCDCSGAVGWVLEALVNGPAGVAWDHPVSTEAWYYDYGSGRPATPGTVGPFGTIAVASLADIPGNAALTISIMHRGGGAYSHMNCAVSLPNGTIIESNGSYGSCSNDSGAYAMDAALWTDHWFLPGPVVDDMGPPMFYPDVSNNNWLSDADLISFLSQLHDLGYAGVVHKVSQGSTFADPYWQTCRSWCEQNNLSWLGYHYVDTSWPVSQAASFVANNGGPNVMLDFEDESGDINNFWAVVDAFNAAGVNVSLAYIPAWYWEQIGQPSLAGLAANGIHLVSSHYPAGPGDALAVYGSAGADAGPGWGSYGGAMPMVWQFTDAASIAGKTVDCNAYRGPGPNLDALFTGNV